MAPLFKCYNDLGVMIGGRLGCGGEGGWCREGLSCSIVAEATLSGPDSKVCYFSRTIYYVFSGH